MVAVGQNVVVSVWNVVAATWNAVIFPTIATFDKRR